MEDQKTDVLVINDIELVAKAFEVACIRIGDAVCLFVENHKETFKKFTSSDLNFSVPSLVHLIDSFKNCHAKYRPDLHKTLSIFQLGQNYKAVASEGKKRIDLYRKCFMALKTFSNIRRNYGY